MAARVDREVLRSLMQAPVQFSGWKRTAARTLGVSPGAVSYHIRRLELEAQERGICARCGQPHQNKGDRHG